jgi:hypothetical protein
MYCFFVSRVNFLFFKFLPIIIFFCYSFIYFVFSRDGVDQRPSQLRPGMTRRGQLRPSSGQTRRDQLQPSSDQLWPSSDQGQGGEARSRGSACELGRDEMGDVRAAATSGMCGRRRP